MIQRSGIDHFLRAVSNVNGSFPASENEIMLSEDALEQLGISDPAINMEIPLSYYDKNGQSGKNFCIKRMVSFLYRLGNGLCL